MLLFQRCLGVDDRPVSLSRTRKQISVEETLHRDFHHVKEAERFLETTLLPALHKRLQQVSEYKNMESLRWQDIRAKAQTVKLKFHDFNQTTVSKVSNRGFTGTVLSVTARSLAAQPRPFCPFIGTRHYASGSG